MNQAQVLLTEVNMQGLTRALAIMPAASSYRRGPANFKSILELKVEAAKHGLQLTTGCNYITAAKYGLAASHYFMLALGSAGIDKGLEFQQLSCPVSFAIRTCKDKNATRKERAIDRQADATVISIACLVRRLESTYSS